MFAPIVCFQAQEDNYVPAIWVCSLQNRLIRPAHILMLLNCRLKHVQSLQQNLPHADILLYNHLVGTLGLRLSRRCECAQMADRSHAEM